MKQPDLWKKIEVFDINATTNDNGFSVKLASENNWTYEFTKNAIIEYKKFMYLAATCNFTVSPSHIVDQVWHLHLTYSKSYNSFCLLLGKNIEHNPSNYTDAEVLFYKSAKNKTKIEYETLFGPQPDAYWKNHDLFDQLGLKKAKYKFRTKLVFLLLLFLVFLFPCYLLTKNLIRSIESSLFLGLDIVVFISSIMILSFYNFRRTKSIILNLDKNCFIFQLTPLELIYIKSKSVYDKYAFFAYLRLMIVRGFKKIFIKGTSLLQPPSKKIIPVIHAVVNNLIINNKIIINSDLKIEKSPKLSHLDISSEALLEYIPDEGIFYPELINKIIRRSNFMNIENAMNSLEKYFSKSKTVSSLLMTNTAILSSIIFFNFLRLINGVVREKDVEFLIIFLILMIVVSVKYIHHIYTMVTRQSLTQYYQDVIITNSKRKENWAWDYLIFREAMYHKSFRLLIGSIEFQNNSDGISGCGSSGGSSGCGSSCGSSCGGGCGGCGGD